MSAGRAARLSPARGPPGLVWSPRTGAKERGTSLVHLPIDQEVSEVAVAQARMSRSEAGRKGGLTTKRRYGADFYQRIGRKGCKKGGLTTKQRYGPEFYRTIGRKGGSR